MQRIWLVAVLSVCCSILFAQANQQGSQNQTNGPEEKQLHEGASADSSQLSPIQIAAREAATISTQSKQPVSGNVDVLSDTKGVDFGPYLARVLHDVKLNWYNLMPEVARRPVMKTGKVDIEFAITKKGKVEGMKLIGPSGDVSLDRAAWGGIVNANPFPPLPAEFIGQYLALRFHFYYNPNRTSRDEAISVSDLGEQMRKSAKSAIQVKVTPTLVQLAQGTSQQFLVKVKDKKSRIIWHLSGIDCSGSGCGIISEGLYTAPPNVFVPVHVGIVAEVTDQKGRTGRDVAMVTIVHSGVDRQNTARTRIAVRR